MQQSLKSREISSCSSESHHLQQHFDHRKRNLIERERERERETRINIKSMRERWREKDEIKRKRNMGMGGYVVFA